MKKILVIVVTGLHNEGVVPLAIDIGVSGLRKQGLETEIFKMHWRDGKDYLPKERRLIELIEDRSKQYRVVLLGISAGATACINVLAKCDEVNCLVSMSGWLTGVTAANEKYFQYLAGSSIAFGQAVEQLTENFPKLESILDKILVFRGKKDEFVPYETTAITGMNTYDLKSEMHVMSIAYGLVGYSWKIADFIKKSL